ncbi:2-hydroxycarboxylate transporter family protein [Lactococcus piscium]|uniref:2-hydroxycarboxylate transporter family protein n=1 Tax=Pseudolactococcus carnosus TaxID=2749961 RepID=UPI000BE366B8|nr:2-hydroxycarboxylate transporter family protein [Lactococcus carnosus]MBR6894953.1 2-hydroxycarboxylate transporter family protein [Lactococcus sp.]MCJ1972820.1 2-hydroxycarboxylate transporter family protein [Lactococcus carnosus]MCJ1974763.1 2-hydroxycarboxylate transporter family protein [Lactococcus carnosus]MCJ1978523.1 2-hydroxycarboxylate transporter family protein [Lactococcus carnosus]MCJ1981150.1 2-hydroxycarboxylate transporter family protein [Lactococcus carnosus]
MLDRLKQFKIGFIPLPIYLVLLVGYIGITILDVVPEKDMLVSLGVMTVFAYLLEEVGAHIPVLKSLGGKVLVVTFLPAFLVYKNWLPTSTVKVVSSFMSNNNFLMFFITLLVVGSIASMNRVTLVKATSRILLILILCDITGSLVGTGVGMLLGMTAYKAYFFIVAPIMAGGVGEGAMPLSIGYAAVMSGMSQDNIFGQILPCVMLGSLVAVLLSGVLKKIGEMRPALTGNGKLIDSDDEKLDNLKSSNKTVSIEKTLTAGVLAIAIYFLVVWLSSVLKSAVGIQLPAPVILLLVLMGAKMLGYIPKNIETGGASLYGFTVKGVTPSLLFGVGVAKTDWKELIAVFQNPAAILTIIATVFTIVITAFVVSKILGLYPVDTAIAVSCCSGQGGTGALAILAAGDRMTLMPFAQVAVRLGGAMTVTVAIFLMGILS